MNPYKFFCGGWGSLKTISFSTCMSKVCVCVFDGKARWRKRQKNKLIFFAASFEKNKSKKNIGKSV